MCENVSLLTTYENMHFCKPNPQYYGEIAERLGRRPEECIMIGNDAEADIVPAAQAAMHTFYLVRGDGDDKSVTADHRGTLEDFRALMQSWPAPNAGSHHRDREGRRG
jgi:FMN phosphatase YigB (HAD superfamily)